MVDPYQRILSMAVVGKHRKAKELDASLTFQIKSGFKFLDSRINGAVRVLQKTLGIAPSRNYPGREADLAAVASARIYSSI